MKKIIEYITIIKNHCLNNEVVIQKKLGLSPSEFNALIVLEENKIYSSNEFANLVGLSVSRLSRVLASLKNKKIVKVNKNKIDNRLYEIFLTKKGILTKQKILELYDDCEKKMMTGLNSDEQLELIKNLHKLIEII